MERLRLRKKQGWWSGKQRLVEPLSRRRHWHAEPLEARTMLSVTAGSAAPEIQQIVWNGQPVQAYAGRWIVGIDDAGVSSLLATAAQIGVGSRVADFAPDASTGSPSAAPARSVSGFFSPTEGLQSWLQQRSPAQGSLSVVRGLGSAGSQRFFQLQSADEDFGAHWQASLSQLPGLQFFEPDFVMSTTATTPNDALYSTLWGLHNTGQSGGVVDADIDAPEAWDLTTGSSDIVVGVIDTGVDYTHPDLAANIWTNPGEIAGDGLDNDGNGYVDDIHGWDFVNDDSDPMDDNNHGTHVSGTIGGTGNNGTGVVGVNWNVKIMALKYLGAKGHGSTSDAVAALNYATMMRRDHDINIRLTSNSWGGGGYSQALYNAIAASGEQGMLFVAAAGNGDPDGIGDNNDAVPHYPSSYDLDNVIAVAATNDDDQKAGFSNYGSYSVDLAAPGVSVRSTIAGGGYAYFNGTSMATPHVAGVAALAWSIAPTASYQTIRDAIFGGVDLIPAMDGITSTGGRLNALGTLKQLGMRVTTTSPAAGSVISSLPTSFVVNFSNPYVAGSVAAGDFSVNGTPADAFTLTDSDTVTFHFVSTPIVGQGLQTMSMAEGALARASDGAGLNAFSNTFRYDVLPLAVASVVPATGATAQLPLAGLQVTFNEPVAAASVSIDDLTLNQGTVTGVSIAGNTVTYALSGLLSEGTLSYSFKAGALTDVYGNPLVAYSGNATLDFGTVPIPGTPLAVGPVGNHVYQTTAAGSIGFIGDSDSFTLTLLAGQVLTIAVDPAAGLRPVLELRNPENVVVGAVTAAAAGSEAVLQHLAAPTTGTYTVTLSAAAGTTGAYTLTATLNAALEGEAHEGASNNTFGTAQGLDGAFVDLGDGGSLATVIGQSDAAQNLLPSEVESNNTTGAANSAVYNFSAYSGNLYQLALNGNITSGDSDWFAIGTLQAGDILSLTASGSASSRGTLANPVVELYRGSSASPTLVTSNDDGGPGSDALVYRFTVSTSDTYYARVRAVSGTGTYQLAAWLENSGTAPGTSGSLTGETESNNSAAAANDAATSWRAVGYRSLTTGAITVGDSDFYQFSFTAGDLVTMVADSTSAMDARVALLNSAGTILALEDGNSVGPGADSSVYAYRIPTTGTYYVRAQARLLTGAYTAGVYLSTTTPPPAPPVNPDWYAFELAAGDRVDLVLDRLTSGNLELALANSAGSVIATGAAGLTNADQMIQQFVAPATGTYYARIGGDAAVPYVLSLVRGAGFEREANDAPTGSLQDLTHLGTLLGYLNYNRPAFTAPVSFTLDPNSSIVAISGDLEGAPFLEQAPGSLSTTYAGALQALIQGNTIQFTGGSLIDALPQAGTFEPGGMEADYAGMIQLAEELTAHGIFHDLTFSVFSGSIPVNSAGEFAATTLNTEILTGALDYSVPGLFSGTYDLAEVTAKNESAQLARLEEIDGVLFVTIPILANDSVMEPNTGLQFNLTLTGQLRASLVLPPRIDPSDYYQVTLAPGEQLTLHTETPLDVSSAGLLNSLAPQLDVLDAADVLVASDVGSAADGKNASLRFTSATGGVYKIRVQAIAGQGEYTLHTHIAPPNAPPVLESIDDQFVAEGAQLSLQVEATDPNFDTLIYSLAPGAPAGAAIDPESGLLTWIAGDDSDGPYSITVVVTDQGVPALAASQTFVVQVSNTAPTANAGGPYQLVEGESLVLAGSGSDPADALTYAWDLNGDGDFSDALGAAPTVAWTRLVELGLGNGPESFSAVLRVDDGDGGVVHSMPASIQIANAPPTVSISGPATGLRGELLSFALSVADPSAVDLDSQFTFTIDWGDGSPLQEVNGYLSWTVSHAFDANGTYEISVVARDRDGASSSIDSLTLQIESVRMAANAEQPGLVDLIWSGTSGSDRVLIEQLDATTVRIQELTLNGAAVSHAQVYENVTGRVIAHGQAGDDELDARGLTTKSATLDGGAHDNLLYGGGGGDVLIGGSNGGEGQQGNNVIIAGDGTNTIYGNAPTARRKSTGGNNLIVGGAGQDTIYGTFGTNTGNGGEGGQNLIVGGGGPDLIYASQVVDGAEGGHGSILVAGTTSLDHEALLSILSEWTSTRSYAARVANILGTGTGARNNGDNYLVPGVTVAADVSVDQLFSDTQGALNWLLYRFDQDSVSRDKAGETKTHVG